MGCLSCPVDAGEFGGKVEVDIGRQSLDQPQVEQRSGKRVDTLR